jgi:5-methylcytosine-specific restriction endonuclease McrA
MFNDKEYHRKSHLERKDIIIAHYGGKCQCCGETQKEFLSVDHINGGGREHKKTLGLTGDGFYRWIIKNNFPDDLRILCYNCNLSMGHLGYCPHELNTLFFNRDNSEESSSEIQ